MTPEERKQEEQRAVNTGASLAILGPILIGFGTGSALVGLGVLLGLIALDIRFTSIMKAIGRGGIAVTEDKAQPAPTKEV